MSTLIGDTRYALRVLRRSRTATTVALVTLALAIGINVAIFAIVDAALLRPLPFPDPDRLVFLARAFPDGTITSSVSMPKFAYWQEHATSFDVVGAYEDLGSGFNMAHRGSPPERLTGTRVTPGFFAALGVQPAIGRTFTARESTDAARVAVLSHGLFARRFGSDRSIVGQSIVLNDEPHVVVGVMPPRFAFPAGSAIWTPLRVSASLDARQGYLGAIGRLRSHATAQSATSELEGLRAAYAAVNPPDVQKGEMFRAVDLHETLYGDVRSALLLFSGAVVLVLLIACVNLANLQLARGVARQREVTIRLALGAGPRRIARQLLTEAVVLSLAGGLLGVLLAQWMLPVIVQFAPPELPRMHGMGIDARAVLFALALSILTGVAFGLVPARRGARLHFAAGYSGHRVVAAPTSRVRLWLIGMQVAMAVMVLVGATLIARAFLTLATRDPGFDARGVISMKLNLLEERYGSGNALHPFAQDLLERMRAAAPVKGAALATSLPLETATYMPFVVAGAATSRLEARGRLRYVGATPEFFAVLQIPVRQGRTFTDRDAVRAPLVAVINETAARRFWPGRSPIGNHIVIGQPNNPEIADQAPRQIVGVVADVREQGMSVQPPPMVYVPLSQVPDPLLKLFVRFVPMALVARPRHGDAVSLAAPVQRAVWSIDPRMPVTQISTLGDIVRQSLATQLFNAMLVCAMAALALVLAAAGIYGVLAYLVTQRTREISIRLALGSTSQRVFALVFRQGLIPVALGFAAGGAGAVATGRSLEAVLYGTPGLDVASVATAGALVLGVALLACYVPARRATRVEASLALKEE